MAPEGHAWHFHVGYAMQAGIALDEVRAIGITLGDDIDALGFDLKTASGKSPEVRFRPGEREDWSDTGN